MSWNHVAYLLDDDPEALKPLTSQQRLILIVAAHNADRRGAIRTSLVEVASLAGATRPTVSHAMVVLEAAGYVERLGHGRYQLGRVFENATIPGERPRRRSSAPIAPGE